MVEKDREVFKLLAFLPVLNNVIFQGLETPGKIQD